MNSIEKSNEQLKKELQDLQSDYLALKKHSDNHITELNFLVESLRKSNEHFNATLDSIPILFFELDSDGRIFDFRAPHNEMLFVQPEVFLGKTIHEILPPDACEIISKAINESLEKGYHKGAIYSLPTQNGMKWYELAISKKEELSLHQTNYIVLVNDITERKQAELENERTQKLLEDSQRIGKIGGWELDLDKMELKWTKEMYIIHEVDLTFKPTVDQRFNFYTPESLLIVDEAIHHAIEHGDSYEVDSVIITAKGNRRSVKAIGKADLKNRRVYGLFQDITERMVIEQALKESEEKFRSIFQNHSAIKLLIDPVSAKIVDANAAAVEYYGWKFDELTNMKISQINISEESVVRNNMKLVSELQKTTFEAEHRRADGSIRNVSVNSGLVKITGKDYLHSIINDITDRKCDEAIIKNQAELLNLAHDSIIVRDMDSKITYWNKGAAQRYGWSSEEVIGKVLHDLLKTIFPIELEEIVNELLHEGYWEGELIHATKDSSILTVSSRWHLQMDTNGKPIAIFEINNDITAQKKAELDIRLKNEELNKINAEKDKFFSILAHDLRGPFNGFLGLSEVMVNDIDQMTLGEIKDISSLLHKSATNLFDLLGNLLEWSRLQRGVITIVPESFLLLPKIHDGLRLITDAAKNKEIQFDYDIPLDLTINTDPNILDSIIRNLGSNAVKFTSKGGGIILSAWAKADNLVTISIKDTGIGMNRQMIDNLFRLDVNTSRKGTEGELSTGMGLIISKDLIEKLGGELHVQSAEGKGSEFKFTIPIKD